MVSLVTLGDPGRLSGGYLYHLRMAEAAPRHGARLVFHSFPERRFPPATATAPAVLREVRGAGPDVVLLDSIVAAATAPWLARLSSALPLAGVLHQPPGGVDHGRFRATLQAPLDRLAWRYARLLIVASEQLAAQLRAQGVPAGKLRVVVPGRDLAPASDGAAPDLRQGRRAALLCVGNWLPNKGILELLEAFARLPRDAATLHLAGDPEVQPGYGARLWARLALPDLAGRVMVHGGLTRAAVADLYRAADVFALPALRESYGTAWGEAMACGLPVVGWRAGNLPHLAVDGVEALQVEPGDVGALSRALARLAYDEAMRLRLGDAARRRAASRPTWDESAATFFAAIRSLRQPHPRGRS